MRERIFQNTVQSDQYREYWKRLWDNSYAFDFQAIYTASIKRRKMFDEVVPKFYRRRSKGEIFINPSILLDEEMDETPTIYDGEDYYSTRSRVEHLHSGFLLSSSFPVLPTLWDAADWEIFDLYSSNSDIDIAVAKAWANVDVSEAAALASLGELPETIAWIASIYKRALTCVRLFKDKKFLIRSISNVSNKSVASGLADVWLEFRYAFRPLVFEMKQALEAARSQIAKGTRQTARGFSRDNSVNSYQRTLVNAFGHGNANVDCKETTTRNVRAGVLFDIEDDINGIMALWGLDKPLDTVWELTPFSFILDWFFNIGNVISAWAPKPSLRTLGSWVTYEELISKEYRNTSIVRNSSTWFGYRVLAPTPVSLGQLRTKRLVKLRYASPTRPILPDLKINLDLAKITDLTLIGQKLLANFRRA